MFEKIEKRDGRIVEFDSSKITAAIAKAGNATGEFSDREAKKLTLRVLTLAHELRLGPTPKVEEIQDIVERVLLDSPFYKTAKAYILYREQHAQIRKITTRANVDLVNHYIEKLDWKIRENSNMSYSLQGLNNYISSEVTSEYWLNTIYPPEIREAHAEGDFHIHDLNLLSVYCVGWDLQDLLLPGVQGVRGQGGELAAQAPAQRPGADRQLLLHPAGRGGRGPGHLQLRHPAGPFIAADRLELHGGQAGPAGVHLQHQHPHPGRLPDAVHQHHPGPHACRRPSGTTRRSWSAAGSSRRPTASSRPRWTCSTGPSPRS